MSERASGGNIQSDGVAATFSCIPSDPLSQNVLASALADINYIIFARATKKIHCERNVLHND